MSKFLYPIYKLKTKSYIKWWLYHKKAGGSGVLSQILEGFSFNLENTLNRKFKLFEIQGNSVQDGSPSPETQVPILSSGDNGSINEKIQTRNLINMIRTLGTPSNTGYDNTNKRTFDVTTLIKFLTANNYYNAGVQIDYSLIDNGIKITTKQAGYGIGFPVILSSAKTYTISANIDVIDNQMIRAIFYKEDGTYITNVTSSGTNKFLTFTTTDDTYFVVVMLTPKANVETTYSNIMLNEGNTALPYVEHQEQTYSIPVQQPFRSIGDVRDCFVKVDGNWFERHKIYRKILDGTENWGADGYYYYLNNATYKIYSFSLCNYAIYKEKSDITNPTTIFALTKSGSNFIEFSKYNFSSVADFKAWLAELYANGTPLYIDYILAIPTLTACTSEQTAILENKPSTYKDFTIIQSEDETPAYLKIQYYKEG